MTNCPPVCSARVVDLGGAAVVPGSTMPTATSATSARRWSRWTCAPLRAHTLDELLAAVERACAAAPQGAWVQGAGYDQNYLGNRTPRRSSWTRVSHGHPVWLVHNSRHMGVANTAAFERAGFPAAATSRPPRAGPHGRCRGGPSGCCRRRHGHWSGRHSRRQAVEDVAEMVGAGRPLLELGVTTITEPGLGAPQHIGHSCPILRATSWREPGNWGYAPPSCRT